MKPKLEFDMENPLELTSTQKKDFKTVKNAFRKKIIECSLTRWKRVNLNQAYYEAICEIF